jgi:hypothetical protein
MLSQERKKDMRKVKNKSTLVVLSLLALTATARAEGTVSAAAPTAAAPTAPAENVTSASVAPAESPPRKFVLGASLLPMGLGRLKYSDSFTSTTTVDTFFAYGLGVSGSYEVLPGLLVGLAPQWLFNVQAKPTDVSFVRMGELDILARLAYSYRLVDTISVYAEALPGFSLIIPSDSSAVSKGFIIGGDVGVLADMTSRTFFNVAGGYQVGFQSQHAGVHNNELRTRYVRVAIGGGVRF